MKHIILTHALNLTVVGFLLLPGCRKENIEVARPDVERPVPEPILCTETIISAIPVEGTVEDELEWKCTDWREVVGSGESRLCTWYPIAPVGEAK